MVVGEWIRIGYYVRLLLLLTFLKRTSSLVLARLSCIGLARIPFGEGWLLIEIESILSFGFIAMFAGLRQSMKEMGRSNVFL